MAEKGLTNASWSGRIQAFTKGDKTSFTVEKTCTPSFQGHASSEAGAGFLIALWGELASRSYQSV